MAVGDVTAQTIQDMQVLRNSNQTYAVEVTDQIHDIVATIAGVVEDINPDWDSRMGYSSPASPDFVVFSPPSNGPVPLTLQDAKAFIETGTTTPAAYIPNDVGTISPFVRPAEPGAPPVVNFNLPVPNTVMPADVADVDINLPGSFVISDVTILDPPSLDDVMIIQTYDNLSITPYIYTADTFDISPDSLARFSYTEEDYTSALKTLAEQRIYTMLAENYSAINPDAEAAIYTRGVERELEDQRLNLVETADTFAAAGFPQPPGALRAKQAKIRSDMMNRAASLSREIIIKQADLAQDTAKFMLDKGLAAVAINLEHFNKVSDRALQVARASVEYSVSIYNAQAQAFNMNLEYIKVGASIHEANIRIMMQAIEANKLELETARIKGELRAQNLQEYNLQLQNIETTIKLYNARVEQSKMLIDGERLKVDVFRAQVEAYIAKVKAKESEYSIYATRLGAEELKMKGHATEVQLYTAKLDAERSRIGAEKEVIVAKALVENSKQDAKRMEIEVYKAQIDRNVQAIAALGEKYRADNSYWAAAITLSDAEARVGVANMNSKSDIIKFAVEQSNNRFRAEMQTFLELTKMKIDGPTASMAALGNIAAAVISQTTNISQALSGVTTIESGDNTTTP